MSNFIAGKTYKLTPNLLMFTQVVLEAQFKGEAGVFKVEAVNEDVAFSDDVTSERTTDRFNIPHSMREDCEEVADAS